MRMKWKFYLLAMLTAVATMFLAGCDKNDPGPVPPPPPPPPPASFFDIVVTDVTPTTAFVTVTPEDNTVAYYFDMLSKADFVDFNDSPKTFMEFYIPFLRENNPNMSLDEILAQILSTGVDSYDFSSLKPETEYMVFAVKVNADGTIPEEGDTATFTTEALLPVDKVDCTFDITVSDIAASSATVSVTPSKNDIPYYFDLISKADYEAAGGNDAAIGGFVSEFLAVLMDYYGQSLEDTVAGICSTGADSYTYEGNLAAETDYYVFACGLTKDGRINTDIAMKPFKTESVKPSDNVFTMEVTNITATGALVSLSTTNNDPYLLDVWKTSALEGLSDDELVAAVEEMYGPFLFFLMGNGDFELDNEGYLDPDTDYTAFVVGYDSGFATTPVTKKTFRTLEGGDPAECTFTITVDPITATSANVTVTPSDTSVAYYFDLMQKAAYTTDEAIVEEFKELFMEEAEAYDQSLEQVVDDYKSRGRDGFSYRVMPETDYLVFAYAINLDATNAGPVTTFEFSTPEQIVGTATTSVTVSKYYDGDALYAADPANYQDAKGGAYIPTTINHSADAEHWWICLFGGDLTDVDRYSDDLIISNIVDQNKGVKDRESINYMSEWGDLTYTGVALDANGHYGPVYRLLFHVSKEGVSPVSDLISTSGMNRASRTVMMSSVSRMIAPEQITRIEALRPERKVATMRERTSLSTRIEARQKAVSVEKSDPAPAMLRTFDMRPAEKPVWFSNKANLR